VVEEWKSRGEAQIPSATSRWQMILSAEKITKDFKGVRALNRVDCDVKMGHIHGLIGPNGSGKTTFFNVIMGSFPATEGKIFFEGRDISGLKPHAIAKMGISRTFQRGFVAPTMTCLENVMCGAHARTKANIVGTFLRLPLTTSAQESRMKEQAREFLEFVGLGGFEDRWARDLVWVERQLLQMARALAAEPKLMLLDEPTSGMGPEESARVAEMIRRIVGMKITVILVSHDMNLVIGLADWITVLNSGEKICEGSPKSIQEDPRVLEAYLGRE